MASNALPKSPEPLFTLAEDMADGAHTHEVAVGLKQNKELTLITDLVPARSAQAAVDAAKLGKTTASRAQQVADSNGKAFIGTTKNALTTAFGNAWSTAWGVVGFADGTLAIPSIVALRQELLKSIGIWLVANPAREIAALNFTAALANAAFTALSDARSAFNQATTVLAQKLNARDTAVATLEKRMRGMIAELVQLLSDTDPRWYAFGLNAPGDPETPGIPDGLALAPGTAGTIYAHWASARRADHYRVWLQIVGVDPAPIAVATVTDPDATLPALPSAKTARIHITSVNAAGESQPSAVVEIVVP